MDRNKQDPASGISGEVLASFVGAFGLGPSTADQTFSFGDFILDHASPSDERSADGDGGERKATGLTTIKLQAVLW